MIQVKAEVDQTVMTVIAPLWGRRGLASCRWYGVRGNLLASRKASEPDRS